MSSTCIGVLELRGSRGRLRLLFFLTGAVSTARVLAGDSVGCFLWRVVQVVKGPTSTPQYLCLHPVIISTTGIYNLLPGDARTQTVCSSRDRIPRHIHHTSENGKCSMILLLLLAQVSNLDCDTFQALVRENSVVRVLVVMILPLSVLRLPRHNPGLVELQEPAVWIQLKLSTKFRDMICCYFV